MSGLIPLFLEGSVWQSVAEAGQVAALSQVSASGQLAVSCSCRVLSHQTLLWHHRLVHPSLPRLCGMHSRLLVSGLPRSLPSLPRSPTLPCLPNPQPQPPLPPPDLVLRQVLSLLSSTGLTPPLLCSPTDQSPPQLLPGSSLPAPAPHTEVNESLTKRREPETRASTPVRARCVARPRPPAVLGTHEMALRPSSDPRRIVLLEPPVSSLPHVPDPESDLASAASPTITRLLATVVTDPDLESTAAFALVTELVDFAARSHLDYVASLVTESESVCPPSIGGEPALSSDVLEDRQFELECLAAAIPGFASMLICPEGDPDALDIPTSRSYAEAIAGEYSSQWQNAMDAEMASRKSTGTYIDEAPPPGANIIDGIRIFIVKRPPGSPPTFKPRYVARGFNQREGVDFFHTFSPTPKRTTLRVLLHVATQRDYEHFLDFSTAFLQGSLHEEIWLRRPLDFTGTTLVALGFASSSADPSLFLRTNTTLPPFYVLVSFSALASSSPRHSPLLCLLATRSQLHLRSSPASGTGFVLGGQDSVALTGHSDASRANDQATQRSSQGYTFSLGSGSVSWRSTRSSCVLGSSCEAEIYAGAMAAQELRWLTYMLTDLGERPHSPPVLYVDNKAMLALYYEQRLEHKTKHIALCCFFARELQQRRQFRVSYVASRTNTGDVFTKALGLVPTMPHLVVT
ncbi:unnamed protein product [Closterium sp. NIES-53]